MRYCKPQILFLVFITLVASVWAGIAGHKTKPVYLEINDRGDTAQVVKVHLFTARDSFEYKDTINDTPIVWVSPLQAMRINVALDTSITYVCSLDAGTNVYGFEYDPSGNDDTTIALLIDNLVDSINNVAGFSDTVIAQDSSSYVKVVSLFAMDNLEGDARWTLILGDSLTKGDSTITTIAMVCDSMPTYINANSVVASAVTGANSGDTVYTVTSDDVGLTFTIAIGDSAQDTSLTQANVTSYSTTQDTFQITQMLYDRNSFNSMYGIFILNASADTLLGVGKSDSGYMWLYSTINSGSNKEYFLIDSVVENSLPCTLRIAQPSNDTLFKEALYMVYRIVDTASDTSSYTPSYNINLDYNLYEK